MAKTVEKPPYRVPSMKEVAHVRWNGLTVATTFAGCGGSSLGYRMAGFRVAWANEFVPAAQDSYRANMAKGTVLDGRDVREVKPEQILRALGMKRGELDVLDGSPPCQAFSMAGKRQKGWGKERAYEHGATQKNEDLFFEFARIVDGVWPKVFVAENVSGLVKGAAKGYFKEILRRLKAAGPGYDVEARLLDAQWLGVPQQRVRLIFVGVRSDLADSIAGPRLPLPLRYRYSVREAIPWIIGATTAEHGYTKADQIKPDQAAPTVNGSPGKGHYQRHEVHVVGNSNAAHPRKGEKTSVDKPIKTVIARRVTHEIVYRGQKGGEPFAERRRSIDDPSATVSAHGYGSAAKHQAGVRIVQGPEVDFRNEGKQVSADEPIPAISAGDGKKRTPRQFLVESRVVHDTGRPNVPPVDITDRPAPTITAGPKARVGGGPRNHFQVEKVSVGGYGGFGNVVLKNAEHSPAATIGTDTSSGNGKNPPSRLYTQRSDGQVEKRKFTILELKRLCAFPDDFELIGSYAQQWERLGNSVPPVMMFHIASAIRNAVFRIGRPSARSGARRAGSSARSTKAKSPKDVARPRGGRRKEVGASDAPAV